MPRIVIGKADGAFARSQKLEDTTLGWRFVNPRLKALYGIDTMAGNGGERGRAMECLARGPGRLRAAFAVARRLGPGLRAVQPGDRCRDDRRAQGRSTTQVSRDEHPRADTTLESLAKLPTPFRDPGTVTAGNASGINDGACALLLADADSARYYGLTPRARVVASAAAGVEPRIMGIGPVPAIRKLLAKTGMALDQIDVIELNEAFAAQALACMRELGLADDAEHVNPNGGAIALGHPLGMSGARLVTTAVNELEARKARYALCTMCIGVGQGMAMLIERI